MATVRYAFRETFKAYVPETLQWYPGHMDKSFHKMQSKIKQVDCVLEVHDARIPFSGRNPNFVKKLIGPKPHILVLNKRDLIDNKTVSIAGQRIKSEVDHIIFTKSKDQHCRGLKKLVPKCIELIGESNRYNRAEERNLRLMVIGVPNVGKSSLINALRNRTLHKGRALAVGAVAGVTKSIQTEIKINLDPPLFLVDTPGILPPRIGDVETGLRLAACSCLNDDVVGKNQIADYILYFCNKHRLFKYVDALGMDEPCDNILEILAHIARNENKLTKFKDISTNTTKLLPDFHYAARLFLRYFREGSFGLFSFDFPYVHSE